MQLKENRKTPNLINRQRPRKQSKQLQGETFLKSKTSFIIHQKKKVSNKSITENIQTQKQITQAQYLTQQQQKKVAKQAARQVRKKVKGMQNQIESGLISVLEQQCQKLANQLQNQKYQSQRKKFQIDNLRKNITLLNEKLEKIHQDHQSLANNNNYGNMQKQQLRDELRNLKISSKRKQDLLEYELKKKSEQNSGLNKTISEYIQQIKGLECVNNQLKDQKLQLEELLQEKTMEAQCIRHQFQVKKKEWDNFRLCFQNQTSKKLEKKGEKINRFQGQLEKITEKLKDEQSIRKKQTDKNKELQREIQRKTQIINNLQAQVISLKKRNNDLSILKSSNNAILNQKLTKLQQQNKKLKNQISFSECKQLTTSQKNIQEKPILFGAIDQE